MCIFVICLKWSIFICNHNQNTDSYNWWTYYVFSWFCCFSGWLGGSIMWCFVILLKWSLFICHHNQNTDSHHLWTYYVFFWFCCFSDWLGGSIMCIFVICLKWSILMCNHNQNTVVIITKTQIHTIDELTMFFLVLLFFWLIGRVNYVHFCDLFEMKHSHV